jgi:hypothetical protein
VSSSVTVAPCGFFDAVAAGWDDADRDPKCESMVIDAALIEQFDNRVVTIHRYSSRGLARGVVAGAPLGADSR